MRLDVNALRFLGQHDYKVLAAIELASARRGGDLVSVAVVESFAGLGFGGTQKCLKTLLLHKLVHHDGSRVDGYRLTYLGYDFLAIKTLFLRGTVVGVGRQIGVGKESDVFEAVDRDGKVLALKLHRLGRASFRAVRRQRDYLHESGHDSWLHLSRLAATKEFAFMKALGEHGFPVPQAIDHNRHAVLMGLVDGQPLAQFRDLQQPGVLLKQLMGLLGQLASLGLVHCDFNEFNLLISDSEKATLIDFPQMVSVQHPNAQALFDRDVDCVIDFFRKKLGYDPNAGGTQCLMRPSLQVAAGLPAAVAAIGDGECLSTEPNFS